MRFKVCSVILFYFCSANWGRNPEALKKQTATWWHKGKEHITAWSLRESRNISLWSGDKHSLTHELMAPITTWMEEELFVFAVTGKACGAVSVARRHVDKFLFYAIDLCRFKALCITPSLPAWSTAHLLPVATGIRLLRDESRLWIATSTQT